MPYLPPESDESIAALTLAGRNLLARSTVLRAKLTGVEPDAPLVSFKLVGFAVGDGGYKLSNPLQVEPINYETLPAEATIAILDNRFDANDAIIINGVEFRVGVVVVDSGVATGGSENAGSGAGQTPGYDDGVIDNSAGFGGTLTVSAGSIDAGAHVGQRLRIIGGALTGMDEQIVANTSSLIEIGILEPAVPLPIGSPLGKSWWQSGAGGLLPDATTTWQILTESPGVGTWVPGATLEDTADNLADTINASTHPLVQNVVKATANNAIVTVEAIAVGVAGNLNTLVESDSSGLAINNFGVLPGTGYLGGGADPGLENPRYPVSAPSDVAAFESVEAPNPSAVSLVCKVPRTAGNYGLGEIGIYADITDSVNPEEVGLRVLYAIGHFPIVAKNNKSVFVTRVITQY